MSVAPRAVISVPAFVAPARFVPVENGFLTVQLPGEVMRCRVDRVISSNAVIVEIDGQPMSKTHQYRKGDKTGAMRRSEYGQDIWVAMDDREFIAHGTPEAPAPRKRVQKAKK